jgi:hypothetical protein
MEDNFKTTQRELARFILDNRPEGLARTYVNTLISVAEGEGDSERLPMSYEFRRPMEGWTGDNERRCPELTADLYVDFSYVETSLDAWGNEWGVYEIKTSINWPSFGSHSPELAVQRVDHMRHVINLAQKIEREFSGRSIYRFSLSKEQRDELVAKQLEEARKALASKLVRENGVKNMRVGQVRSATIPHDTDLPSKWEGIVMIGRFNGEMWSFNVKREAGFMFYTRIS